MFDVVRAWKDEEYRLSLSEEELRHLPSSPVGELELTDADLEAVYGGRGGISANCSGCFGSQCNHASFCIGVSFCIYINISNCRY
jgi:mersacidin/lichenicidin family type 2 lantibiotic